LFTGFWSKFHKYSLAICGRIVDLDNNTLLNVLFNLRSYWICDIGWLKKTARLSRRTIECAKSLWWICALTMSRLFARICTDNFLFQLFQQHACCLLFCRQFFVQRDWVEHYYWISRYLSGFQSFKWKPTFFRKIWRQEADQNNNSAGCHPSG
jgi:hypothetical protein